MNLDVIPICKTKTLGYNRELKRLLSHSLTLYLQPTPQHHRAIDQQGPRQPLCGTIY